MKKIIFIPLIIAMMIGLTNIFSIQNEVKIEVEGGTLYGSLLKADNKSSKTIAIIVAGSGPTDRDGNSEILGGKNDSLKALAYGLKEEGIDTLRYDKRISGKSGEAFKKDSLLFDDYVKDLIHWIRYVKEQHTYNKIYIIGHSQGALVAALAPHQEKVDGIVIISGTVRPIDEILLEQLENGDNKNSSEYRRILDSLREGKQVEEMSEAAMQFFNTKNQPFLLSWMKYDPYEVTKALDIPVYFIYGTTDLQVQTEEVKEWKELVGPENIRIIENMNHVLKKSPKDIIENQKRYVDPSYELHEEIIPEIIRFLATE